MEVVMLHAKKLLIVAPILLAACATSYQPEGFTGGYSDMRMGNDLYRVSFQGNGYTDPDRAADFALLRAAELAISNGASHFAVVDSASSSRQGAFTTPRTSSTTGTMNTYGSTATYNAQTTTYGGQTFIISKPTAQNLVLLVHDPEEFGGPVYEARAVAEGVKNRYGID
jgi:hypothetical protein